MATRSAGIGKYRTLTQTVAWIVLSLIHLMPALAFFRPAALMRLYGVESNSPLFLLIRHRASLFLGVFIACLWASIHPEARLLASLLTSMSMLSFLWLYWRAGGPLSLRIIALFDLIGLPFLLVALLGAFNLL